MYIGRSRLPLSVGMLKSIFIAFMDSTPVDMSHERLSMLASSICLCKEIELIEGLHKEWWGSL